MSGPKSREENFNLPHSCNLPPDLISHNFQILYIVIIKRWVQCTLFISSVNKIRFSLDVAINLPRESIQLTSIILCKLGISIYLIRASSWSLDFSLLHLCKHHLGFRFTSFKRALGNWISVYLICEAASVNCYENYEAATMM